MAWHKIQLTANEIEGQGLLKQLENQFEQFFMQADGPSDMALLSDNKYTGDKIGVYFTPGCSPVCDDLIEKFGGGECDTPQRGRVFLLDGNDDALDLLECH